MKIKIKNKINFNNLIAVIPEVTTEEITPKVIIYDSCNDGSYYFRKIGFSRRITDED